MRLICPNCDAQYEVPDEVIPAEGRDVQCSNCSNTWFFRPGDPEPEAQPEEDAPEIIEPDSPEPDSAAPEVIAQGDDQNESAHQDVEAPVSEDAPDANAGDENDAPSQADAAPEEPAQPTQRGLDPAVADVLREEAAFESRAREAEQETLESQPDLGLETSDSQSDAAKRAEEARHRMAKLRGTAPVAADEPAVSPAASATAAAAAAERTGKGLLPDVEEINSTLRSDADREDTSTTLDDYTTPAPKKSGGFRRGFVWMVLLAVIGAALYVFAPQLSEAVPQVSDPLTQYSALIDSGRAWLDAQIISLLGALDGAASES